MTRQSSEHGKSRARENESELLHSVNERLRLGLTLANFSFAGF